MHEDPCDQGEWRLRRVDCSYISHHNRLQAHRGRKQDFWQLRDNYVVRLRKRKRRAKFTPESTNCPAPTTELEPWRQTTVRRPGQSEQPYRSWCPICVRAKGRQDAYKRNEERQPVIQVDFSYTKTAPDEEPLPILTAPDVTTQPPNGNRNTEQGYRARVHEQLSKCLHPGMWTRRRNSTK